MVISSLQPAADAQTQYAALTQTAGLADLSDRTLIEISGADRAAFLHNLCTNDILKLRPGDGCELFFTDVKGKILAHANAFCEADALVLDTVAGQADKLIAHLDRYLIREDVQLIDLSEQWAQLLLTGPDAATVVKNHFGIDPPEARLAHRAAQADGRGFRLARTDMFGPVGFLIRGTLGDLQATAPALADLATVCGPEAVETVRIEAGMPLYGIDITEDNLPQEVARDRMAISFTKGCYLGQETIARIDALGHVNRLLCGVRFSGSDVPPPGTPLSAEEKQIGKVTSATFSPRLGAPLALAYLRRGHHEPRTKLTSPLGEAEVIGLPIS